MKNNQLVTKALERLEVEDVSSDELENGQDSDEEEEVKVENLGFQNADGPINDVAMSGNQLEGGSKVKDEHMALIREMSKNFTIRFRLLDLKSNPDFKDLS